MKFKKLLLGTMVVAAGLSLAACGNSKSAGETAKVKDKGTLVVALSPDYPPFEFQTIKNGKNTVVGSDVDLANAIGKKLGVKVQISTMDFNNVLASIQTGKADIAISGITATPDREKSFDFSESYYEPKNYVVVKKSDVNKYKSLSDFAGKSVAAQKGSIQEQIVQKDLKSANEVPLATIADEINEIKAGQVQGAVIEDLIAKAYVSENPDLAILDVDVPAPQDNYGTAVALPKGSDLKDTVNEVIKELKANGQIEKDIQTNYDLSQKVK